MRDNHRLAFEQNFRTSVTKDLLLLFEHPCNTFQSERHGGPFFAKFIIFRANRTKKCLPGKEMGKKSLFYSLIQTIQLLYAIGITNRQTDRPTGQSRNLCRRMSNDQFRLPLPDGGYYPLDRVAPSERWCARCTSSIVVRFQAVPYGSACPSSTRRVHLTFEIGAPRVCTENGTLFVFADINVYLNIPHRTERIS